MDNNQARSWPTATRFLPSRSTRPSVLYTNILVGRLVKKIRLFDTRSALLRVADELGSNPRLELQITGHLVCARTI